MLSKQSKISAVIIGNEILAGRRQDAHLNHTIASCNARGLRLHQAIFLSDNSEDLIETYTRLRKQKHVILSFGGIGATPDDRTRQAVAEACGVEIVLHPEGMKILKSKFGTEELTINRCDLVAFPHGATLIPNPINQIPGFSIDDIHCVPGFPQMAQPMMEWVLDSYYQTLAQERVYVSIQVNAPESEISPLMQQLERDFPHVSISSLPQIHHTLELGFEGRQSEITQAKQKAQQWLTLQGFYYQENR